MSDKFKTNFLIVLPAAVATVILLMVFSAGGHPAAQAGTYSWVKVLPYLGVLIFALLGFNVMAVIFGGIVLAGVIGISDGSLTLHTYLTAITEGIGGMSELIILSLLIGGMAEMMKRNGGIAFLLQFVSRRIRSKKERKRALPALSARQTWRRPTIRLPSLQRGRWLKIYPTGTESTTGNRRASSISFPVLFKD